MDQKKPTLKSIAKALGVSTATVSNAFNRPDQLSLSLRERILNECKAIGYTGPSVTARALRTGKTGIIGVLLADFLAYNFTDPVATEFMRGVSEALDEVHVNMLLLPSDAENYQNTQVDSIPDSFIIYGKPMDSGIVERLRAQGKPVVAVDFQAEGMASINVDNHQACYEIAKHALAGGANKALILGLRLESSTSLSLARLDQLYDRDESISRCRYDGFMQALDEAGIKMSRKDVWQIHDLEPSSMNTFLRGALTAPDRPDVLLCMSDRLALAASSVAAQLGIAVPGQLKIIGFDDIPEAKSAGITTVRQPIAEKGRLAAKMALGLVSYESVILNTELKVRSSC